MLTYSIKHSAKLLIGVIRYCFVCRLSWLLVLRAICGAANGVVRGQAQEEKLIVAISRLWLLLCCSAAQCLSGEG